MKKSERCISTIPTPSPCFNREVVVNEETPEFTMVGGHATVARIAEVDPQGQVIVDIPGGGLRQARLTAQAGERLKDSDPHGREVLLVFDHNDGDAPIIVDVLQSLIDAIVQTPGEPMERRVISCDKELVLECGDASITLTRTGKILIRGKYVVSHSTGANKIRGASVQIN